MHRRRTLASARLVRASQRREAAGRNIIKRLEKPLVHPVCRGHSSSTRRQHCTPVLLSFESARPLLLFCVYCLHHLSHSPGFSHNFPSVPLPFPPIPCSLSTPPRSLEGSSPCSRRIASSRRSVVLASNCRPASALSAATSSFAVLPSALLPIISNPLPLSSLSSHLPSPPSPFPALPFSPTPATAPHACTNAHACARQESQRSSC